MSTWTDEFIDRFAPADAVPPDVLSFPSMTTPREKSLLFALGRAHYRGRGAIVDAGLFLGASTHAFCSGIRQNPGAQALLAGRSAKAIQAYEIALWSSAGFDKYMDDPIARRALAGHQYCDGDDYSPLLRRLLAEHDDLIDFRIGDIEKLAHTDDEVEIAFYDCLKNDARDRAAFLAFGPHFVPGHTIVVQQDYFYEDALDLKIRQEFLAPYFSFLGAIATSAVFRLERAIPSEYFVDDPLGGLGLDERVALLQQAADRIPRSPFQLYAQIGVARYLILNDSAEAALRILDEVDAVIQTMKLPPRPADVSRKAREWAQGVLRRA